MYRLLLTDRVRNKKWGK